MLAAGNFDPALGLNAGAENPNVGEETDLMRKLLLAGLEAWYLPAAKIRHIVPTAKVSLAHLAKRRRAWGLYQARDLPMYRVVPLLGVPSRLVLRILFRFGVWLVAKVAGRKGYARYLLLQEALGLAEGFRLRYLRRRAVVSPAPAS
jgi:GT2 family glycosyltransferase